MMNTITRSVMPITALALGLTAKACAAGSGDIGASDPTKHFDPKGKMPSEYTNHQAFDLLRSSIVRFTMDFEVLPGTGGKRLKQPTGDPFEFVPPAINAITD